MSVLVADLVGRSTVQDKTKTKSNILTLIIRVASGVIGHGANTLKTLIVNGLMLLSQTVLKASEDVGDDQSSAPVTGSPIDWVLKNSYIKSKIREATSDDLPDRLEQLAFGMPCVQLLMCRIAPVVRHMQYEVKGRWGESRTGHKPWGYNGTCWEGVKSNAKTCSEKYYACEKSMKYSSNN
ncbi:uncharacterized protein LOC126841092 [Adelges cooleyi]|uniref:uncharacterized protein LOC126841092 n=1 Tax=Adelges cooleyi TaxID=133065 RepID=UPI0021807F3D|nr:uncharacterized protein LOC126841092 [Adelges cooleyi]